MEGGASGSYREGRNYVYGSIFGEPESDRVGGSMALSFLLCSEWVSPLCEEGYMRALETSKTEQWVYSTCSLNRALNRAGFKDAVT